jgi:hypothetical protein
LHGLSPSLNDHAGGRASHALPDHGGANVGVGCD